MSKGTPKMPMSKGVEGWVKHLTCSRWAKVLTPENPHLVRLAWFVCKRDQCELPRKPISFLILREHLGCIPVYVEGSPLRGCENGVDELKSPHLSTPL